MGEYEDLSENIDTTQVHQIEVIFGTDTTVDSDTECKTPMLSGESGNCSIGKYMTHPAFISFETNGLWVGKFETGYKGATSVSEAQKNVNDSSKIQIKPNVYSWRGIQVANAYLSSYNYKREYDSHMMKNTEWGAVAYLQHSIYGSHESVRINNNQLYVTGYAGVHEPTCGNIGINEECNKYEAIIPFTDGTYTVNYLNSLSNLASTTGNISGIYDMSGGAWEYVMGVMFSSNNTPCIGKDTTYNSGFKGEYCNVDTSEVDGVDFSSDSKYYDSYYYGISNKNFNHRILGDAIGEMGPFINNVKNRQVNSWYENESLFIWNSYPWFYRGGMWNRGTGSGMFAFGHDAGSENSGIGYRIALTAK